MLVGKEKTKLNRDPKNGFILGSKLNYVQMAGQNEARLLFCRYCTKFQATNFARAGADITKVSKAKCFRVTTNATCQVQNSIP